ncbi:MAG: CHAD domain-containing protein [Acidobacteria bacterium]|nr:CHAD domain-containing protein [Acidobacteriota bacterium]NIQ30646.1 CHAD domain-containing protein [Acidobacteriota bacterium]NIQ85604.1 CHAD domain-containing protein [Acidobacteriota bacterium]
MRAVLSAQLAAMQGHEPGVIADRDPEELHRFRVALRRTRSCIGQLKQALPKKPITKLKGEFAWLGAATGPSRDLDVFLEDMKRYRKKLPEASRPSLDPLIGLIKTDKQGEHQRLVAALESERYRSLIGKWRKFLNSPFDLDEAPQSDRPITEVAAARIRSRYDRMIRSGRKIDAREDTEALHRLRIEGKKLRYLLEFFRDEFPPETVSPVISTLKNLQDHLGRFNDLQVQQESVEALIERLRAMESTPASTLETAGDLIERLARKEQKLRGRFADEFARFDSAEMASRIPEGSS